MSAWEKVKLGDLVSITTGKKDVNFGSDGGRYPFFTCAREIHHCDSYSFDCDAILLAGNCDIGNIQRYCGKFEAYQRTYVLQLIANKRATLDWVWNCIRHNWVRYNKSKMFGAAIPYIRLGTLQEFPIPLPPLPTQQRIALILSDYDAAIANCRRQIALLEEAAQRLYREWFAEGKGEEKTIEEICDTIGGGTPSTSNPEYWDGDIPWVVPTDITKNRCLTLLSTEKKITKLGLAKSSAKMLPPKAILMTSRASVGYFGIADFPVCTNQGFISVVPHEENMRWYLLFNLMARVEEIRAKAKGVTFAEISKSSFRAMIVTVPDQAKLVSFGENVSMMMEQELALSRQIRILTEARDRLLPKLMSGEVAV